jgi:hypothetical protein
MKACIIARDVKDQELEIKKAILNAEINGRVEQDEEGRRRDLPVIGCRPRGGHILLTKIKGQSLYQST